MLIIIKLPHTTLQSYMIWSVNKVKSPPNTIKQDDISFFFLDPTHN